MNAILVTIGHYLLNLLIAFDQFANAIFGGDRDETISSRLGKRSQKGCQFCHYFCQLLSWVLRDPDHCIGSIEKDEGKDSLSEVSGLFLGAALLTSIFLLFLLF